MPASAEKARGEGPPDPRTPAGDRAARLWVGGVGRGSRGAGDPGGAGRGAAAREGARLSIGKRGERGRRRGARIGTPVRRPRGSGRSSSPGRGDDCRRLPGAPCSPRGSAGGAARGEWGARGAPPPHPTFRSPRAAQPPGRGRGNRLGTSWQAGDLLSCVLATRSPADSASRRPRTWLRRWVAAGGRKRAGGRGGAEMVTPGGLRGSLRGGDTPSPLPAGLPPPWARSRTPTPTPRGCGAEGAGRWAACGSRGTPRGWTQAPRGARTRRPPARGWL